ncbi:RNA polymerase sigma factor [Paraliomyxa miuraensis]|uniref:RNA polymerase sigma factor n=1 Tax=Paraliomyxa miuraensis TaxID=376150 RepID=UPI0022555AAF|nr:sigma-70 family RNA polymerase sigma factor [Paraliomyxa miuraensis]MCX4241195.1 sigma-70 family RNA polymerase sigma factor [Paraliomyxa miuraensis]
MPTTDETDFELLERWRDGDPSASNELARRHYDSVRRFFEVRLTHAADDLTQRTFLACIESLSKQSLHTSFRSYLFGVARNQMLMHLRSSSRIDGLRSFAESSPERPSRKTTLTGVFARCEQQGLLLQALVELPPDLQIVVQLYYWEGMATAEIGEVVQIPASTVTTRLARARELVKRSLVKMKLTPKMHASIVRDVPGWTRSLVDPRGRRPSG